MSQKPINERALSLLKKLVEVYIRDGQPVGSKTLAEETPFALSPASIRNIMSELEEAGYLHSPHTSAGRVPTVQGYRLFVNNLLTISPLEQINLQQLQQEWKAEEDKRALITRASHLLSHITHLAGMVTLPRRQRVILRQVEFLPLSKTRILVVLVTQDYEIQNRIIFAGRPYSPSELQEASNYLTQHFAGMDLFDMRKALLTAMQNDKEDMESRMKTVMDLAEKMCEKTPQEKDYVMAGENNLLSMAEETGVKRLRILFDAFNQKRDMLNLLDQCVYAKGVQIFIGEESGYQALDACSLVTAPYQIDGEIIGVLAVIGPTRMAYERVISAVDVTAKLLSTALSEKVE
jgi:heat-inducible transcriptional repressor